MMLISYTGQKSGKAVSLPVNYVRIDKSVWVVSYQSRKWWRNFTGNTAVTVHIQGQNMQGRGKAIAPPANVAAGLQLYLQQVPHYAKYFNVSIDAKGNLDFNDVTRAAQNRVMVKIELSE